MDNRSIAFQDGIDKNENVKSVSFHQLVKMQQKLTWRLQFYSYQTIGNSGATFQSKKYQAKPDCRG